MASDTNDGMDPRDDARRRHAMSSCLNPPGSTKKELQAIVDKLPRYADHPANGDKAGEPFVSDRDDCYSVVIPGGSVFSARPRFIGGVWLSCPQYGNLPFNTPILFFATREAAQQYADEQKGNK